MSLITDAGTPVLSDPGNFIINECVKNGIKSLLFQDLLRFLLAVSLSGFSDKCLFYGFLPKTEIELDKSIKKFNIFLFIRLVFFAPAIKINFYIKNFKKYFAGRKNIHCKGNDKKT